jgi:LytS/YehU family sensor histidine kinase
VVTAGEEIDYLSEYVALQRLRLRTVTHVEAKMKAETPELPVAPMLLVSFVENAFKYESSSMVDCNIIIYAEEKEGRLTLYVYNSYINAHAKSSGQGIANTRRRLELLYAGHYHLDCGRRGDGYEVKLEIELC